MKSERNTTNLLLALIAAGGDREKALELLEWAAVLSHNDGRRTRSRMRNHTNDTTKTMTVEDATHLFIDKYLTPLDRFLPSVQKSFIKAYITKENTPEVMPDFNVIRGHINTMSRTDFYNTYYWRSVSYHKKESLNYTCQECGAIGTRMIAYHLNYDHYGDEINHLDEISCKCRICMSNNRETE